MTDKCVPVLTLADVSFEYGGAQAPALRNLTLTVQEGEWLAVIGPGGSGKSTLCRLVGGLLQATPGAGRMSGQLQLRGVNRVDGYTSHEAAGRIGHVSQDPETGIVMDFVDDELAFGPENLCVPPKQLDGRIDEALDAVGLPRSMRSRRTDELSGGQQQRIAIAAALSMQPQLLVFDDAAANLDGEGAKRLLATQRLLHRRGCTIIGSAPRWDGVGGADRVILLADGMIAAEGTPDEVFTRHQDVLRRLGCLPSDSLEAAGAAEQPGEAARSSRAAILEVRGLNYAYPHGNGRLALNRMDAECREGEIVAVTGPNGSGKTTFGKLVAGLLRAPLGSVRLLGRDSASYALGELAQTVGYVFQRPDRSFVAETVLEECLYGLRAKRRTKEPLREDTEKGLAWLQEFSLYDVRTLHPQSLTITQQRLLNLASVLLLEPKLIVLDEPTAGLDYAATDRLMSFCGAFAARGGAAIVMTHDPYVVCRWATDTISFG